ncbi:MFS transporter [Breznakia pachnodae]|uniref:MFS family permease n=1 Tax=Breznakia pachnodae TaxID=265178 RepID=A0ABU0E0W4_9FIRM|nr:MFS transporter [Breznakia pachnodae]MDQ0360424.1 MFS family permease [Breznakia pachnodae]
MTKSLNRVFINICIVGFIMSIGQFMLNTLLPRYVDQLGASPVIVGFITSSFTISSLLLKPISGPAVDYYNKKYILAGSIFILCIAFLGYSFSYNIIFLFIFRLLHGCGMAFTVIASLGIITDIVGKEDLTRAITYYGMVQAIAGAVGPSIGLYLSNTIGYNQTFFIGMVIMIIAFIFTLTLKTNTTIHNKQDKMKISLDKIVAKEALVPAIIMIFLAATYNSISSFLTLYADAINVANIGMFFTVNAIALIISKPSLGICSKRFGEYRVLPFAIICFSFSVLLISFSTNLIMFLIASVFSAIGYGSCQPLIQALCIKSVPRNRSGSASATSYYGTDIGYLISPILSGQMVELFGYSAMFRIMACLPVISLVLFVIFRKRIKKICIKDSYILKE